MLVWCFKNTNMLEKRKTSFTAQRRCFILLPSAPAVSVKGLLSNIVRLVVEGKLTAVEGPLQAALSSLRTDLSRSAIGRGVLAGGAGVPDNANEAEGSCALVGSLELRSIHQLHMCFRSNVSLVERKDLLLFRTPWMYCFLSWTGWPFFCNILIWRSRCEPLSSDRNPDQ